MKITIRRARDNDAPELSTLAKGSKAHWGYTNAQMQAWQVDLTITPEKIASTQTFLAQADGITAGFYSMLTGPDIWQLEHFWISPEAMGQGIGKALFSHAVSIARQGGAKAIAIDADPNAEAFYIKCGAVRVGFKDTPIPGQPARIRPQLLITL